MKSDSTNCLSLPGSYIRVVYSIDGLEMFAMGTAVDWARDHITMKQYADQYGPVHPFLLTIQWSDVIRLTMNGPAATHGSTQAYGT